MNWSLVAACNDDSLLESCLLASPGIGNGVDFQVMRGYDSASKAYNTALGRAKTDIVVFAHQDIVLPTAWASQLRDAIGALAASGRAWGVLGVFGISEEERPVGHVYCTGLGHVLGRPFPRPVNAISLDEVVLIVNRVAGLRFDEGLSGFHLYGTDIALEARRRGIGAFVISAFCLHNTQGLEYLPPSYWAACRYLRRKWHSILPVQTPCIRLTRMGIPRFLHPMRSFYALRIKGERPGGRVASPVDLLQRLLWSVGASSPNGSVGACGMRKE